MRELKIIVLGEPVPQGSKKAFYIPNLKRAVVVDDNKAKLKTWRSEVSGGADEAMRKAGLPVADNHPVTVDLEFYFSAPKSKKKTIYAKCTKPDVDKLCRAVLDALTGVVFKDDSQVVQMNAGKQFGDRPRVELTVRVYRHEEFRLEPRP